jgi:pSer/pThr/pTyr-binding forkhead associated (FHA) protein
VRLSVLKDDSQKEEINLSQFIKEGDKGPFSFYLGRSKDCQIKLDGREISRKQAEISFAEGVWSINNLSPSIPLIINGVPTAKAVLETGNDIFLGPYRIFVVSAEAPPVKEEESPPSEDTEDEEQEEVVEDDVEKEEGEFSSEEEPENLDFSDNEVSPDAETSTFGGEEEGETEEASFESNDEGGFDEGGFDEEEGGGFDEGDDDGMGVTDEPTRDLPFVEFDLALFGEFAPYEKFVIKDKETFIGRDPEKCAIILNDPEVSSIHAVIKKSNYQCELEDLGSKNGTLLNGKRVNRSFIANEDEFIIGSTTFSVSAHSRFLEQEAGRLMPVEENQVIDVEQEVDLEASFEEGEEGEEGEETAKGEKTAKEPKKKMSLLEQIKTDPVKKKRAIMIGGVLVLALLLIDTGPEKPTEKEKAAKIAKQKAAAKKKDDKKKKQKFKPEQLDFLDSTYLLAKELFKQGKYAETLFELQKVFTITPDYKNAKQINELAKRGLAKMEEIERKRREEIARKKREQRVKDLVKKAEVAVKERSPDMAKGLFSQILKLDPENYEVTQLKLEIESWEKEAQRKEEEEARKRAERDKKVEQLSPGKNAYLAKEWYKAIVRLNQFMQIGGMDEDLIKEGSEMLIDAKKQLANIVDPILEKAEALMEGQDLKGAYEEYKKVLFFDPSQQKPLEEMERIQNRLTVRARKIYREAIVAESLSLFQDAKTKFLEVQQVSPSDSDYYKKATEKLKNYLDYE